MTGRMRMFARGGWKRPVLGFVIIFLYWNSILAWTDIREEPSVSIFLSGVCPDGRKAEEILETEAGSENPSGICFYQDAGLKELSDTQYGRTSQAPAGGLYGSAALYDSRLNGFSQEDRTGCVIDEKTALDLFGTTEGEGRPLSFDGREYTVRKVIPWKQQMILFHPEERENTCTRVFLEVTGNSRENSARQFMIKYGLTGVLTDGGFLKAPVSAALMLLPGMIFVCLFKAMVSERKKYGFQNASYWLWTAAGFLLAGTVVVFLWRNVRIPGDWIPGKWSDFAFWQEKLKTEAERMKLYLMFPKSVLQTENIMSGLISVFYSITAFVLSFLWKKT